jgi:branched-subunit amino acid ABC-type transport system permease component
VGYGLLRGVVGVPETGGEPGLVTLLATMLGAGLATGLLAVLVERLCYRPLRHSGRVVALLSALGVSLFLQNLGQQTVGPQYRKFPPTVADTRYPRTPVELEALRPGQRHERDLILVHFRRGPDGRDQQLTDFVAGAGEALQTERLEEARRLAAQSTRPAQVYAQSRVGVSSRQIILVLTLAAVSAALYVLVMHTRFGRAMRAVSVDFDAARLMGVDVDRVIAGTFFIGAFVAGLGGVLAGGMYYERIDPLMGLMPGLKAFIAAVLGGIGSLPGAVLGAMLLGVSEKMTEAYVSSGLRDALAFGILIAVLLVRPQGLLGESEGEKI